MMDETVAAAPPAEAGEAARDRSLADVLSGVRVEAQELEGCVPFWQCIDWQLAQAYWHGAGLTGFVSGDIPFMVNNTGRLSEHAAAVLFETCAAAAPQSGPIVIAELGAGSGLFARYLLDAFQALCAERRTSFYDRLLFVVSDSSPRTIEQWRERELFAAHAEHVALCTADAQSAASLRGVALGPAPDLSGQPLTAVFCNYVLDVLPMTMVRRESGVVLEPWVRSLLSRRGAPNEPEWTAARARALIRSGATSEREALVSLLGAFDFEVSWRPASPELTALAEQAFGWWPESERVTLSFGAFEALLAWLPRLAEHGFVLVNDYGSSSPAEPGPAPQRFGPSLACGLDFAWLDRALQARGWIVDVPEGDRERAVRARLVTRGGAERQRAIFHNRFAASVERDLDAPLVEARALSSRGDKNAALDAYRVALDRSPRDFRLIGEIAEFVGLELGDFASGRELAEGALRYNPWLSPWLWNVLGDCLFCERRFEEAHAAYRSAERIDPGDARTNLNLAYTLSERGELGEALRVIARGLESDPDGAYRPRLLDKQSQVLSALGARRKEQSQRMLARLERVR